MLPSYPTVKDAMEIHYKEHPDTAQTLDEKDIHANHVEAQNAALRRKNSAFRRRTLCQI